MQYITEIILKYYYTINLYSIAKEFKKRKYYVNYRDLKDVLHTRFIKNIYSNKNIIVSSSPQSNTIYYILHKNYSDCIKVFNQKFLTKDGTHKIQLKMYGKRPIDRVEISAYNMYTFIYVDFSKGPFIYNKDCHVIDSTFEQILESFKTGLVKKVRKVWGDIGPCRYESCE